jgi:hypothetical protein
MIDELPPIQAAMLHILLDGGLHTQRELHRCLSDTLSPLSNVACHLTRMRKKLRPMGYDIVCRTVEGTTYYQYAQLLAKGGS